MNLRLRRGRYDIDMLNGPVLPRILSFALPLMLSSMLQLTFNAADVIVVGRFEGDAALAAVGAVQVEVVALLAARIAFVWV